MDLQQDSRLPATNTMSTWPKLSRAPIVEALIDLRIEPSSGEVGAALKEAADELAGEFPSRSELHSFVAQFQIAPTPGAPVATAQETPQGVILRSIDQKWAAQFRLDGFTVSHLQPYSSWEALLAKVRDLWDRYAAAAKPKKIVRIACRYINRIAIPDDEPFEKTFLTNFTIGPSLPQAVAGYLLRVGLPFAEHDAIAILTQSIESPTSDCILDIDAFSENAQGIEPNSIWEKLEHLRQIKNQLFFGSLTEAAIERLR